MATTKVLNLYAGIGGNRKLWDEVEDIDVTAVEWDEEKAEVYRDYFPDDEVIVADAHEFLINNLESFDFIWSSPPCPTHSQMERINHAQHSPRYPDMDLYEEIIILKQHHERLGFDFCVENVESYYEPLVTPQKVSRHYFWTNFNVTDHDTPLLAKRGEYSIEGRESDSSFDYNEHEAGLGYDLGGYNIPKSKKGKMLRNCVHPELGKHIFKQATIDRQTTLV